MVRENSRPIVVIVGRPNVGKSTLFNRLLGRPSSIVSDIAGTTRDRVIAETEWSGRSFILIDTGGLEIFPESELMNRINSQIVMAIEEADVVLMVTDAIDGITHSDRDVAEVVRRTQKPVVLAVNKSDNDRRVAEAVGFYELGLGDPITLSAYHNTGLDDVMSQVVSMLPQPNLETRIEVDTRIAIVGRTNVGKSMLVNSIVGHERSIVSAVPGTTRDALDTRVFFKDKTLLLIDTAGIRRRGSILPGIERYSVLRSIRAIDRADVAVLLMDASELATNQDAHVAGYILDAYKGIIIVINKWDLSTSLNLCQEDVEQKVRQRFKFAQYAPIHFVSALKDTGVDSLLDKVFNVHCEWRKGVPRYDLKRIVMNAVADHPPSPTGRRSLKIYGVAQDQKGPPSFTFYVNNSEFAHFSYRRYLENTIRNAYRFSGSPLRIRFKGRGER